MLGSVMEHHQAAGWDGIVFDLSLVASDRPLAKTLSVLSVLGSPDAKP